jgi:HD-like signal output (HDOD) protein
LGAELNKEEPDTHVIIRLIRVDMGLSAAMLKTVNSPFFGPVNKTSCVASALSLLGTRRASQIVSSLALRNSVVGDLRLLGQF